MMSLSISVVDAAGKKSGSVELPADIFDAQTNIPLIHQVVVAQRAAARQGTHKAKTRGEVSGGGKKPFKQKGTGRARQGSTRAVQMRHGGVAHGPVPRSYDQRTPKKMKSAALRGALSDRARNGRVHVITEVLSGDPSTKQALAAVSQFSDRKHLLVVLSRNEESAWRALRNSDRVHLLVPDQLNTYDVIVSDDVVFTKAALDEFIAGPARGKSASAVGRATDVEVSA
jgi:large subunit ribosomal protein L4